MRQLHSLILVACLAPIGCHRARHVSLEDIQARVQAMERATVERTLLTLFPDHEGWLILPGVASSPADDASLLGCYRVVAPDSLPADAWMRFLRGGDRVELLDVHGSPLVPQRTEPVGLRGLVVRFSTSGIGATAILVDAAAMRWIVWYEGLGDMHTRCPQHLALELAAFMAGDGPPPDDSDTPECRLYPPAPSPVVEEDSLLALARRSPLPRIEGMARADEFIPDLTLGRRLVFGAPSDPLLNQEPFLLQRRLERFPGPRIVLSRDRPLELTSGTYLWAVSTLGQARAMRLDGEVGPPCACTGHSVLFFGRPVLAAGTLWVDEQGHIIADAFPGEYALSPFSPHSIKHARDFGRRLFPRIGRLLAAIPGPEEGGQWPSLRVTPRGPCG